MWRCRDLRDFERFEGRNEYLTLVAAGCQIPAPQHAEDHSENATMVDAGRPVALPI